MGRILHGDDLGCQNCGGEDFSFDRSLCACGSMHDYCNDCGKAYACPLDVAANPEVEDMMHRFTAALRGPLGDGQVKRKAGTKPPWYHDDDHWPALARHIWRYQNGERVDPDSGCHPMVHIAARALMIACRENNDVPE